MADRELTLARVGADGSTLVLVDDDGTEFTLPLDARLRAALRGRSSTGSSRLRATADDQLEMAMESALRPRDIQSRIRAGETPEHVAAAAQTTLDRVMTYAGPVLAERAHVAQRALQASVRRRAADGPAGHLADAVAERLRARHVDPGSVEWDAWRRDDGRWTLTASYSSGESRRRAEFCYDAAGRYVVAEDDESRWLVGERSASHGPQPRDSGFGRRSSATGPDAPLPLADDDGGRHDALGSDVLGSDVLGLADEQERTTDLSEPARALRSVPDADRADADWIVTQASDRAVAEAGPDPDANDPEANDDADTGTARGARKARGRASVPSWDEIMFGAGRD